MFFKIEKIIEINGEFNKCELEKNLCNKIFKIE